MTTAATVAASVEVTGSILLLGMGGSHAVNRAVEPLYRALGIEAIAVPLSEQLGQPLPIDDRTVLITSQSGESAEVLRWFQENDGGTQRHLRPDAGRLLVARQGRTVARRCRRHRACLCRDAKPDGQLRLASRDPRRLGQRSHGRTCRASERNHEGQRAGARRFRKCFSGRHLWPPSAGPCGSTGAWPYRTLSPAPAFRSKAVSLRHGPMEMLGPEIGVVLFRGQDHDRRACDRDGRVGRRDRLAASSSSTPRARRPSRVQRRSAFEPASDMAAIFAMLPVAQRFMVAFADARVENAGTPVRSTKITRSE